MSHDLSHSKPQLLQFQINPLSHTHTNTHTHAHTRTHTHTHTHIHILFQRSLSLQTLVSNLHLHLHVPFHSVYLVSLVLHIKLNTLMFMFYITTGTHNFSNGSLILLQPRLYLLVLML